MQFRNFPDILFVSVDTMRRDAMAPYGEDLMPTATRLLEEGVGFDACFAPSPWTAPSFGSVLTGLWPREHGCLENTPRRGARPRRSPLPRSVAFLPQVLQDARYQTVCIQGNVGYLGPEMGFTRAFDVWWAYVADEGGRLRKEKRALMAAGGCRYAAHIFSKMRWLLSSRLPERSVMQNGQSLVSAALRAAGKSPQDRPLFLWINFMDMHTPYYPPLHWRPRPEAGNRTRPAHLMPQAYPRDRLSDADKRYVRRLYASAARYVDSCLGKLLDGWRLAHRARSRLTVFFSDHGEEFWEHGNYPMDPLYHTRGCDHGHTLFNELVSVPLIFHWPEGGLKADRVGSLVSLVDVTPTLVDLLGLDRACGHFGGRSLVGHLSGASPGEHDGRVVFADSLLFGPERQAAISGTYKLIRFPKSGKTELFAWGAGDPEEQHDLASRPASAPFVSNLSAALNEWDATLQPSSGDQAYTPEDEARLTARLRNLGYVD